MVKNLRERILNAPAWRWLALVLFFLGAGLLILGGLLAPSFTGDTTLTLSLGEVAPQDIRAPTAISYQSQVLTEQRQEAAANAVNPVYSPPDTRIARQQVDMLRNTLNYVATVREDRFATPEQKSSDLAALQDIELSQETSEALLSLNESRWQVVRQEAIVVLEQVMRNTIRETQLEDARRMVPALVSLSIPLEQAKIVGELASAFVAPNSLFNESLTEAAREQARQSVSPVTRAFAAGETIVERGRLVTAADLEALERFGFLQPQNRWQDLASSATLAVLVMGLFTLYLRFNPALTQDLRSLALLGVLFLVFLYGARLFIPGHTVLPYLYPLAAFSLVLASLFGTSYGLLFAIPLSVLVAFDLPNALALTFFYLLGSLFGVLMVGKAQRISAFIWGGVAVSVASAAAVIAFRLPDPNTDLVGIATLTGAAFLNGIASAGLAVLLQFFLAQVLGMTTALQLQELSRPDNSLLQYLLRTAPGTYQHSLQVANLAEQAAERIGADPLLTRVGALYHDVGKAINPNFFIENQPTGFDNPHNQLDPYESAQIIIKHVPDGLEMARKYRLPPRILDFIREHHGTLVTRYQYVTAVNAAGGDEAEVDISLFSYPGPRPQSRETALVMLADGCEARARADVPKTEQQLTDLVKTVVENRVAAGQMDLTEMTMRDLQMVVDCFISTLRGMYHPRLEYPTLESRPVPEASRSLARDSASAVEPLTQVDSTS